SPRDLHSFPTRRSSDLSPSLAKRSLPSPRNTYTRSTSTLWCKPSEYSTQRAARTAGEITSNAATPSHLSVPTGMPILTVFGEHRSEEHTSELQSRRDLV